MKLFAAKVLFMLILGCILSGCGDSQPDPGNIADVGGLWQAEVTIQSCTPASVCNSLEFPTGTAGATMVLNQLNDRVQGTFNYNNTSINASITGVVGATSVAVTGTAITNTGQVTIRLSGVVSGGVIHATIEHNLTLIDSETGTASGTGDFTSL
jgi:hypothetical protein